MYLPDNKQKSKAGTRCGNTLSPDREASLPCQRLFSHALASIIIPRGLSIGKLSWAFLCCIGAGYGFIHHLAPYLFVESGDCGKYPPSLYQHLGGRNI